MNKTSMYVLANKESYIGIVLSDVWTEGQLKIKCSYTR